jgi:hypothetical protein
VAIAVVYGLSSVSLAHHVWARWFPRLRVSFWVIRAAILMFTIGVGVILFGPAGLFGRPTVFWIPLVPCGLALGVLSSTADRAIIRRCLRSGLFTAKAGNLTRFRQGEVKLVWSGRMNRVGGNKRRDFASTAAMRNEPAGVRDFSCAALTTTAILEELVYRGVLLRVCFLLQNPALVVAAILVTESAFSLLHVHFGWPHVFAKTPLSVIAAMATLLSGTVLPAVLAHIVFNLIAWQNRRN